MRSLEQPVRVTRRGPGVKLQAIGMWLLLHPSEPNEHTQGRFGESSLPLTQHSWGHLLVSIERPWFKDGAGLGPRVLPPALPAINAAG